MASRYLYLVRHGQYDPDAPAPDALEGCLSKLGKQQAQKTAKALQAYPITAIHCSTLRRAAETAEIIAAVFPEMKINRTRRLWESIPHVSDYMRDHFQNFLPDQLKTQAERSEKAFEHYFKSTKGTDKHEILVAHGNLIRYFVCRTLRVDAGAWLRMDCHNCGITCVRVNEMGDTFLISYNDTGHLPPKLRTDNFYNLR